MKMTLNKTTSSILLALTVLNGCAVHNAATGNIDTNLALATKLLADKQKQSMMNVERVDGIYLGDSPIKVKTRDLPAFFAKKFEYAEQTSQLYQIAEAITSKTGVFTHVTDDAMAVSNGGDTLQQQAADIAKAGQQPNATNNSNLLPQPTPINNSNSAQPSGPKLVSLQPYSGTLSGFLDMATARFGLSWRYEGGQIIIYALETRSFTVSSVDSTVEVTARVGNSSSGSGNAGQSGNQVTATTEQSTKATTIMSPWKSIENNVRSMLSRYGRVVASPVTNSLIVTDSPAILDRVGTYLEAENKKLSKRVDLYVKVYSVKTTKGENYGLDWNAVYRFVKDASTSGYPLAPGYSVSATTGGNLSFKLSPNSTSPWAGSDLMFKALSSQGNVSELTSAHVSPLNNRPAPIFVGRQIGYLAKTSVTSTDSTSSVSMEPGNISSGFTLNLLPSVLDKGRINLRYSMDIASLVNLQTIKVGEQQIQVPDIDTRSLFLDTAVQNGETLVIAGFEQDSNSVKGSGLGSPRNILFGGSSEASVGKDVLVVVITSYSVDR